MTAIDLVKITKSVSRPDLDFTSLQRLLVDLANQKLAALKALWERKRGERAMPSRVDLDFSELKTWLGHLALIDLSATDGGVFRLCGTNLSSRFGGEVTGFELQSLPNDIGESIRSCVARVRETRAPLGDRHARMIDGSKVTFEEIVFPLSDDGVVVKTVLFACYPTRAVQR